MNARVQALAWEETSIWSGANTSQLRGAAALSFLAVLAFLYGWTLLFCKKAFAPQPHKPQAAAAASYVADAGASTGNVAADAV